MRLFYRGVGYEHESVPVNEIDSGLEGQYRGQKFHFTYPRHIPVPQPVRTLEYRGTTYRTTSTGSIESVTPARKLLEQSLTKVMQPKGCSASQQAVKEEAARIHRVNIQRRLQHRLEVAKAKGDQALIRQLEQEMHLVH